MHWLYYVLIAAAVIILLNVVIALYMTLAARERSPE
jgi:hypothetical protein